MPGVPTMPLFYGTFLAVVVVADWDDKRMDVRKEIGLVARSLYSFRVRSGRMMTSLDWKRTPWLVLRRQTPQNFLLQSKVATLEILYWLISKIRRPQHFYIYQSATFLMEISILSPQRQRDRLLMDNPERSVQGTPTRELITVRTCQISCFRRKAEVL
jgi:hypothetical protein